MKQLWSWHNLFLFFPGGELPFTWRKSDSFLSLYSLEPELSKNMSTKPQWLRTHSFLMGCNLDLSCSFCLDNQQGQVWKPQRGPVCGSWGLSNDHFVPFVFPWEQSQQFCHQIFTRERIFSGRKWFAQYYYSNFSERVYTEKKIPFLLQTSEWAKLERFLDFEL